MGRVGISRYCNIAVTSYSITAALLHSELASGSRFVSQELLLDRHSLPKLTVSQNHDSHTGSYNFGPALLY